MTRTELSHSIINYLIIHDLVIFFQVKTASDKTAKPSISFICINKTTDKR